MPPSRPSLIKLLTCVPRLGGQVREIHDAWLRRRIHSYWARARSSADRPVLNETQERVLSDLTRCGIAQVHFDELGIDRGLWQALLNQTQGWLESEKVRERVRQYVEGNHREAKWKEYIVMMTAVEGGSFPIDCSLLQLGLHPLILDLVNSYLGLMARLFHIDIWKTIPLPHQGPLIGSQRWHRDPEDLKLVKVFLYLNDIGADSGPLHYLKHSRRGERYGHLWPQRLPYGSVAPPAEVERQAPRSDWAVCTAPAGTFIFADTTGLHMGGRASLHERVFATWGYASPGTVWPRYYQLDPTVGSPELSPAAKQALFD